MCSEPASFTVFTSARTGYTDSQTQELGSWLRPMFERCKCFYECDSALIWTLKSQTSHFTVQILFSSTNDEKHREKVNEAWEAVLHKWLLIHKASMESRCIQFIWFVAIVWMNMKTHLQMWTGKILAGKSMRLKENIWH